MLRWAAAVRVRGIYIHCAISPGNVIIIKMRSSKASLPSVFAYVYTRRSDYKFLQVHVGPQRSTDVSATERLWSRSAASVAKSYFLSCMVLIIHPSCRSQSVVFAAHSVIVPFDYQLHLSRCFTACSIRSMRFAAERQLHVCMTGARVLVCCR